ncbi:MAG: hypothetical protein KDE20_07815 [Caldilineaceae bacterium]|nr:hypothetical protein [Caldilineaceae bacterium]
MTATKFLERSAARAPGSFPGGLALVPAAGASADSAPPFGGGAGSTADADSCAIA